MTSHTLRQTLMQGTRDLHERLDRGIGALQSEGEYRRFLIGSHAFRAALEPALNPACGWQALQLAPTLRADLADLNLTPAPEPAAPRLAGIAAQAGALYVAEGSALGARLLYRRAQALGMGSAHGARHLAAQTSETRRWSRFLDWLEASGADPGQAMAAANAVFALALCAYGLEAAV